MRRLKGQLSLTMALIVLFTVAVISLLSNILISGEFEKYIGAQQKEKADDMISNFSGQYDGLTGRWNEEYLHGAGMYALYDGYIVKVYDREGAIVWDAENHDMSACHQVMTEISARMKKWRPDMQGSFAAHDYPLTQNGQAVGSLSISYYGPYFLSDSDFRFLGALNTVLVAVGLASLFAALLVSGVLARRIARPIIRTGYIAKQISQGDYSARFEGNTGTLELDELTAAINHLSDRLAGQERMRKQLTADVAHELRTPLTTLSSHLEMMIEGVWEPSAERLQSCYEEIGRLSGLVADLERLEEMEHENLALHKTRVDLMEVVRTVCASFAADLKKKDLFLTVEGGFSILEADRDKLCQVMVNLLSNAVKYTGAHGHICVRVEDGEDHATLTVEDDGIGIPPQELSLVFERLYRTDKSRNRESGGAGIGLAIVKSIALAHGGTVRAESRGEQGSRFIMTLPKL